MQYEQARQIIKDGDIVFIHGSWKQPIQALIMFFTFSRFAHVCVAFWQDLGGEEKRLMCVESQGLAKRRILSLSFYKNKKMTIVSAPKAWDLVKEKALSRIGQVKYGYFEAVWVGLREFFQKTLGVRLPRLDTAGEICSEFVAEVYDLPEDNVSPQKLFEQLIVNHQCKVKEAA